MEKLRHSGSGESDQANGRAQREVQENKNLLSSSVHLTDSLDQRRSRKQKKNGKREAGLDSMRVEQNEAVVDSRCLMQSRRRVKNKCVEVMHNLSPHVFPTPSPEETSVNTRYSDVFKLEVVDYINLSGWVKPANDYKRFCSLLTQSEMENLASVYYTKKLAAHSLSSEKEISVSRGKETYFNVKDQQNLLGNESEDILHASVVSRQLPLIVDVHHDDCLDASRTRRLSQSVFALAPLPAESFIDDKGKHWSSECVDNRIDYQLSVEKDTDIGAKLRFCSRSKSGESLVPRSVSVNDLHETCNSTVELASFQEHLYSLLRLHTVFESHFPDAKPWWQDIGFLHVYNIAMAGIFFYLVIT